jgi:hypothetical protein
MIVQEDELNFDYSPHALFAAIYPKELYVDIRFMVVNGEKEILPAGSG